MNNRPVDFFFWGGSGRAKQDGVWAHNQQWWNVIFPWRAERNCMRYDVIASCRWHYSCCCKFFRPIHSRLFVFFWLLAEQRAHNNRPQIVWLPTYIHCIQHTPYKSTTMINKQHDTIYDEIWCDRSYVMPWQRTIKHVNEMAEACILLQVEWELSTNGQRKASDQW